MKKIKIFLTIFAIVATVGSALAVKANFFGQGSIYCSNTCAAASRVNFRDNPNGTAIRPCGSTGGIENASYSFCDATCSLNNPGHKYDAVSAGK